MENTQNQTIEETKKTFKEKFQNFSKTAKSMLRAIGKSLKFSFTYAPGATVVNIISEMISAILPFFTLYNWSALINELTASGVTSKAWTHVAVYGIITVCQLGIDNFGSYMNILSERTIDKELLRLRADKMATLDMGKYDDPKFADIMSVLDNTPWYSNITRYFIQFIRHFIALFIALPQLFRVYPAASIMIIVFYLPTIVVSCLNNIASFKQWENQYRDQRKCSYYREILTEKNYAQERKLYGYDNLLRGKYKTAWNTMFKDQMKLQRKNLGKNVISSGIQTMGMISLLIFMAADMMKGTLLPGNVALYIGLGNTLMSSADNVGRFFAYLHNDYQQCDGKFDKFLALETSLDESGTRQMNEMPEIEFKNVSFNYPGKEETVLKNLNFKIQKGEKLALVGINGAGKSTITKLLMRIYDPTEGEILFDGIPAKEYDINSLRSVFSVTFQFSVRYCMTLKENITISNVNNYNEERFDIACRMSGVDELAKSFKDGYDTPVSRYFVDDGFEPSGGQRQKIGLARAFYRNTGVMILDEPSSALDAEAEDHIFNQFMTLCKDKSAVLISHRMSAVVMTDKIAMIEHGELLEFGTHIELMENNGRYAHLYNLQADKYREGIADEDKK